uniref:DPPIV_N domain-containing protein n=1 Tax=Steinernema glaseri TaxID=37863 RepID=A0A1I8AQL0_9BILA
MVYEQGGGDLATLEHETIRVATLDRICEEEIEVMKGHHSTRLRPSRTNYDNTELTWITPWPGPESLGGPEGLNSLRGSWGKGGMSQNDKGSPPLCPPLQLLAVLNAEVEANEQHARSISWIQYTRNSATVVIFVSEKSHQVLCYTCDIRRRHASLWTLDLDDDQGNLQQTTHNSTNGSQHGHRPNHVADRKPSKSLTKALPRSTFRTKKERWTYPAEAHQDGLNHVARSDSVDLSILLERHPRISL